MKRRETKIYLGRVRGVGVAPGSQHSTHKHRSLRKELSANEEKNTADIGSSSHG